MMIWKAWSKEIFEEAAEQLKLILLMLVSDLNSCSMDAQFQPGAQEAYTLEEIERNFLPVKVTVEERPDIELLLSPGYYPSTLLLSPEGRILCVVQPQEKDLYEVLFQARRQYINEGTKAGVPVGMPAYPVQEAFSWGMNEIQTVIGALMRSCEQELQRIATPLSEQKTIGFEGKMLLFVTQAALILRDEHLTSLAGQYMEHMAAVLWDPHNNGFFASIQGETPLPIKKLSHQLEAMEALVSFAQQDETSSRRAIEALLQAIEGNFSKDEGLYSTYSSTTTMYTADNMHLLRCLLLARDKELLPAGLEANISLFATRLEQTVADDGSVAVLPFASARASVPLLSTQVACARAFFACYRYNKETRFLQKGLRALGYAISHLMLSLGGVLMAKDQSDRLPLLRPLDANMEFVLACLEAAELTEASMYRECARNVLAMFRQNYSGFGNQKYTYGTGLLALVVAENLLEAGES